MSSFVKFDKIAKKVNNKNLLANLSFGVQQNEVLFILGNSGSGKSTLFKILMNIVNRDKGNIFVNGMNYDTRKEEINSIIGYLPQENIFDSKFSILENLCFYGQLKGMDLSLIDKQSNRWADIFGFKKYLHMMPDQVPNDYLRKISLSRVFFNNPEVLLLDNPTLGMNFLDRKLIWDVINEFKKDKSILCINQNFEEAEFYGDRVIVIHNGSVAMNSSMDNINNSIDNTYRYQFIFKRIVPHEFLKLMKKNSKIKNIVSRNKYFEFSTNQKSIFFKTFQMALNYELIDLKFNYSKLNEIYLKVTE